MKFDYDENQENHRVRRRENERANPINNKDKTKEEDEVAPASTFQGGARGVRMAVPKKENSSHGGQLGAAARIYKAMKTDEPLQFLTILIPENQGEK